jgi:hypothetical protein
LDPERKYNLHKLAYPFNLIKQNSEASLSIKQDDSNMKLCILSDKALDFIREEDIMKDLLQSEYYISNIALI